MFAQGVTRSGSTVSGSFILLAVFRAIGDCGMIRAEAIAQLPQRIFPEPQKRSVPSLSTGHVVVLLAISSADKARLLCDTNASFFLSGSTESNPFELANHWREASADCAETGVDGNSLDARAVKSNPGSIWLPSKRWRPAIAITWLQEGGG